MEQSQKLLLPYNLSYKGVVTIKYGDNLIKKFENEGTMDLAELFANTLVGKYDQSLAPSKIDLTNINFNSYLTEPALILSKHFEYNNSDNTIPEYYSAYLQATISKDMMTRDLSTVEAPKYLVLLNSTGVALAYTNIDAYAKQNNWFKQIICDWKTKEKAQAKNITIIWQMQLLYNNCEIQEIS